jgi:hypothetical protein
MKKFILCAILLLVPSLVTAQCPPIVSQFSSASSVSSFNSFGSSSIFMPSVGLPPIVSSNVFLAQPAFVGSSVLFAAQPTVFLNTAFVGRSRFASANVNVKVRNRGR